MKSFADDHVVTDETVDNSETTIINTNDKIKYLFL